MEELKLTVYFEDPFWVGVFERTQNGALSACKITFGAEPKDYEVQRFILHHFYGLRFSPALPAVQRTQSSNPKRRQRQAQRQLSGAGTGTKSMQALAAQREQLKTERKPHPAGSGAAAPLCPETAKEARKAQGTLTKRSAAGQPEQAQENRC